MRKVWPVLLLIVGLVMFAVAAAQGIGGFADSLRTVGQSWTAPAVSTQNLSAGDYVIYERSQLRTVEPMDVQVTGPAGPVAVGGTTSTNLTLGNTDYVGVAAFTAPQDGSYTVEVAGDGQELVLGPSIAGTLSSAFTWIGIGALGGLLALAGLVWLVVELIVSGRRPSPAVPGAQGVPVVQGAPTVQAPPAAQGSWYPDPEDPSQWRWWDGRQWTDHRQPRGPR